MIKEIFCSLIIQTKKEENAKSILLKFQKKYIPYEIFKNKIEPYWKGLNKYRAEFVFDIVKEEDINSNLNLFWNLISNISTDWNLIISKNFTAFHFDLSCVTENIHLPGIEWLNFEASCRIPPRSP